MSVTSQELERLLKLSDSRNDATRHGARDVLDDLAPALARELIAARKVKEAARIAVNEWTDHLEDGDPVPTWVAPLSVAITEYDEATK